MTDPRWQEWLEATERAIHASEHEWPLVLEQACVVRTRIQHSLVDSPPIDRPDEDLAARLCRTETTLEARMAEMLEGARARMRELRRARDATQGYRPAQTARPSLVSRSI